MTDALLIALVIAFIGQTGVVWRKLGNIESNIKGNKCPFGNCPIFERAKDEAVSNRKVTER